MSMKVVTVEEARDLNRAYVASRNGLMKSTRYGGAGKPVQFRTIRPINLASSLPEIPKSLILDRFEPLPKALIEKIVAVFRAAYEAMQTEMAVIVRWDAAGYNITRPTFALTQSANVKHLYTGTDKIGVFHSHPTFTGTPSGVDDNAELSTPGLYAVFGHVTTDTPDIFMSVTADGMRRQMDLPDYGPLNVPVLTDQEKAWWLEFARPEDWVTSKTTGFWIMDLDGKTPMWWAETQEQAKELANGLDVKPAENRVFRVYTGYDDYDDMWCGWDTPRQPVAATPTKIETKKSKKRKKHRKIAEIATFAAKQDGFVMVYSGCSKDMAEVGRSILDVLTGPEALDLLEGLIQACDESEELEEKDTPSSAAGGLDMPWLSR